MESVKTEKSRNIVSNAVEHQASGSNGKSMPAVPVLQQKSENKTGLPDDLKTGIETVSGLSMDDTRVHYNSSQPAQLNALVYAQGSNIHIGPGQEKHLPHEAWHVVQQKQGRVKPTIQMKEGVPVNDDAGLENEADIMGAKALSVAPRETVVLKKSTVSGASFQLKNALQANIINGYVHNGSAPLYNNNYGMSGNVYEKTLNVAADGIANVMVALTTELATLGTGTSAITFLDAINALPALPSTGNWGTKAKRDTYITALRTKINSDSAAYDGLAPWDADPAVRATVNTFVGHFAGDRTNFRNHQSVGLIDPFIAKITIQTPTQRWVYEVNFSKSANTYITAIEDPTLGRRAEIRPEAIVDKPTDGAPEKAANRAREFGAQKDTAVAGGGDPLVYSSGHVQTDRTIDHQLGVRGAAGTKGEHHERLDAQTKLAAEGARFLPIRNAGTALSTDSRFYGTIPGIADAAATYKFVNYVLLTNRWGQWFNSAFNITAATIIPFVDANGTPTTGDDLNFDPDLQPRPGKDYDLENDRMF